MKIVRWSLLSIALAFLILPVGGPIGKTAGNVGLGVQHVEAWDLAGGSPCDPNGTVTWWEGAICLLIGVAITALIVFLGSIMLYGTGWGVRRFGPHQKQVVGQRLGCWLKLHLPLLQL